MEGPRRDRRRAIGCLHRDRDSAGRVVVQDLLHNRGRTSCVVPDLTDDATLYTFTVTATLGTGTSGATSTPTPATYNAGSSPLTEPLTVPALAADNGGPSSPGPSPPTTVAPRSPSTRSRHDPSQRAACVRARRRAQPPARSAGPDQRDGLHLHRGGERTARTSPAAVCVRRVPPFAYIAARARQRSCHRPARSLRWEFVDLTNKSGDVVRLGGYGFWNTESSNYLNGSSLEDRAAYLFDARDNSPPGRRCAFFSGLQPARSCERPIGSTSSWQRIHSSTARHRLRRTGQPEPRADRLPRLSR